MLKTERSDVFARDVIGVGALNLDYLATAPALAETGTATSPTADLAKILTELDPPLAWNTERTVSQQGIKAALGEFPGKATSVALGGSAFNAIHALATMKLNLRIGYLGMTGHIPPPAPTFTDEFDALAIERTFVRQLESEYAGICLSVTEHGEPTLVTHPGANTHLASFLAEESEEIVGYLASARVVHVTSFLDVETPRHLLRVLSAVKRRSPRTLLSVDPGHEWCMGRSPSFKGILALADYLSVNETELRTLASDGPHGSDDQAARWVLSKFMAPNAVLVAKSPHGARCYQMLHGEVTVDQYTHTPLPEREIVDATGAGDVFVAGLLAGIVTSPQRLAPGALLGMRLAKLHLQYLGAHGQERFADIAREFVPARPMAPDHPDAAPEPPAT